MKPQCLNPFVREIPQLVDELGFPLKQAFPCGKCPVCVASDSKDWMLRLQVEKDNSFNSHFITLTYNEKNIVRNGSVGTLVKRDIQLFLKRLRKRIADKFPNSPKLRFFAVGEYGPTTLRPHYHAIIFNLPTGCNLHRFIEDCWSKGFVTISPVTGNRIAYVASYSMFTFLFNPMGNTSVQNPFRIMSRRPGIGEKFITTERHRYYQSHFDGITYKGFRYLFPDSTRIDYLIQWSLRNNMAFTLQDTVKNRSISILRCISKSTNPVLPIDSLRLLKNKQGDI